MVTHSDRLALGGTQKTRQQLIPIFVGFVARLAVIPFMNLARPVLWEYGDIARFMLRGFGYAFQITAAGISAKPYPTAIMPPGETLIHFAGLWAFGDGKYGYIAILVIHAICGIGFIYYSGEIAWKIFRNDRLKTITLWIAALYPSFVYATGTFGLAAVVLFLNAFFIWTAIGFSESIETRQNRVRRSMLLGLAAGLLGYFRAESPLLVGMTLLLILYLNRKALGGSLRPILLMVMIYLSMQAPWMIRNCVVFHKLIIGSSSGAFNLWRGNSDCATGSSWDAEGNTVATPDSIWALVVPSHVTDAGTEQRWLQTLFHSSTEWMEANPTEMAVLDLKKIVLLWGIDWYSPLARTWEYVSLYIGTLLLSLLGLFRLTRREFRPRISNAPGLYLIALWCVVYTLISMIFFSLPRFQIFLIGLYLPILALGVNSVIEKVFGATSNGDQIGVT